MYAQKYKSICKCIHEKAFISKINSKVSLCFNCSCVIFTDEHGKKMSTIKPSKFEARQETATPLFLYIPDNQTPKTFRNKSAFLKFRNIIVKKMKIFCSNFNLSKKTFFLSLEYLDRICSKMVDFEMEDLLQISQFCIILATKFNESQIKNMQVKSDLGPINNYSKDELYLLQLLNYDLLINTSYDILMDILYTGFLFEDEKFSLKKMNLIYGKIENMLYFFSETKNYIDMTHKEIALALIGLIRETLGLNAYNNILKNIFMNEYTNIQSYYSCLNKLRKFFKIKDDNNHSDSNTDANSDNSFDSNLDNSIESNNNKISKNDGNVKSSLVKTNLKISNNDL